MTFSQSRVGRKAAQFAAVVHQCIVKRGPVGFSAADGLGRAKLAMLLGTNLKARRQARGWTQAALAERVELSPHYIALLEAAKKLPTLETLATLAEAVPAGNSAETDAEVDRSQCRNSRQQAASRS